MATASSAVSLIPATAQTSENISDQSCLSILRPTVRALGADMMPAHLYRMQQDIASPAPMSSATPPSSSAAMNSLLNNVAFQMMRQVSLPPRGDSSSHDAVAGPMAYPVCAVDLDDATESLSTTPARYAGVLPDMQMRASTPQLLPPTLIEHTQDNSFRSQSATPPPRPPSSVSMSPSMRASARQAGIADSTISSPSVLPATPTSTNALTSAPTIQNPQPTLHHPQPLLQHLEPLLPQNLDPAKMMFLLQMYMANGMIDFGSMVQGNQVAGVNGGSGATALEPGSDGRGMFAVNNTTTMPPCTDSYSTLPIINGQGFVNPADLMQPDNTFLQPQTSTYSITSSASMPSSSACAPPATSSCADSSRDSVCSFGTPSLTHGLNSPSSTVRSRLSSTASSISLPSSIASRLTGRLMDINIRQADDRDNVENRSNKSDIRQLDVDSIMASDNGDTDSQDGSGDYEEETEDEEVEEVRDDEEGVNMRMRHTPQSTNKPGSRCTGQGTPFPLQHARSQRRKQMLVTPSPSPQPQSSDLSEAHSLSSSKGAGTGRQGMSSMDGGLDLMNIGVILEGLGSSNTPTVVDGVRPSAGIDAAILSPKSMLLNLMRQSQHRPIPHTRPSTTSTAASNDATGSRTHDRKNRHSHRQQLPLRDYVLEAPFWNQSSNDLCLPMLNDQLATLEIHLRSLGVTDEELEQHRKPKGRVAVKPEETATASSGRAATTPARRGRPRGRGRKMYTAPRVPASDASSSSPSNGTGTGCEEMDTETEMTGSFWLDSAPQRVRNLQRVSRGGTKRERGRVKKGISEAALPTSPEENAVSDPMIEEPRQTLPQFQVQQGQQMQQSLHFLADDGVRHNTTSSPTNVAATAYVTLPVTMPSTGADLTSTGADASSIPPFLVSPVTSSSTSSPATTGFDSNLTTPYPATTAATQFYLCSAPGENNLLHLFVTQAASYHQPNPGADAIKQEEPSAMLMAGRLGNVGGDGSPSTAMSEDTTGNPTSANSAADAMQNSGTPTRRGRGRVRGSSRRK
ncbi:hypothetical protein HK102_003999 [Quaeritorhiza haematococci]|nr:hypothetical protein HK102_003999 [Quaeritorhiza haematococci]